MPLAHQLGLYNINNELGNIYFRWMEPTQYRQIMAKLKATEKQREELMQEFIEPLKKKLSDEGIVYKLKVRTKTAYSIYRKMQVQKVPFEGVYDVFAIRFIIDCEPDPALEKDLCWKVYSFVTEEYEPDTHRLRDWLTTPRPNGYESLHITVKNKKGVYLEVQIRTRRMDDEAENGAAAHWAYKGIRHEQTMDRWLKSVRYSLEHPVEVSPEDLPAPPTDDIFVFTPTGELRILAAGASVLDFAFNIHSGIGSRCTGGKVNGKPVPIREKLKTGDVVEILTSRNQRPTRDWLNWVVTSKARGKIKQELDVEERKAAAEGREILERRLRNWKLELPDDMLNEFMKARKYTSVLPFMAAIGREEIDVNDIKSFIQNHSAAEAAKIEAMRQEDAARLAAAGGNKPEYNSGGDDILVINAKGVKGLEYKMAGCCNPVFGDDVFGFVTRTQGITIHRNNCPNAARLWEKYPYRCQKVVWQDTNSGSFQAALKIEAAADHAVIGKLMEVIGSFKASIRSFNVSEREKNHVLEYEITARILVPSNLELDKVVSQLSIMPKVKSVRRL
jgi:GTP pyrophosphokinase